MMKSCGRIANAIVLLHIVQGGIEVGIVRKYTSDADLLEHLFTAYRGRMYGIAFSILHDEMQAEDAVGDAFEKLLPYLGRCQHEDEENIRRLLAKLVKNAAIDIYRRNKKEAGRIFLDEEEYLRDQENPIDEYVESVVNQERVDMLQYMLPDHYWNVIKLRYMEGMSVGEIAVKLGLSEENVYTRLRRARKKARELLEETA